jgi:hypothetical protein
VKAVNVDIDRKFSPKRVVFKDGKYGFTYTDNFSLEVELLLPSWKIVTRKQESVWNVFKPGAWEEYEKETNVCSKEIGKIAEDKNLEIEEVVRKVDKELKKINFKCFG